MTDDRVVGDVRRIFGDVGALAERMQARRSDASMQPLGAPEDPIAAATRR